MVSLSLVKDTVVTQGTSPIGALVKNDGNMARTINFISGDPAQALQTGLNPGHSTMLIGWNIDIRFVGGSLDGGPDRPLAVVEFV